MQATKKIKRMLSTSRFYTPVINRAVTIYGDDFVIKLAQQCIRLHKHQKSQRPSVRAIFMRKLKQLPKSAEIFKPKRQSLPTIVEEEEDILMEIDPAPKTDKNRRKDILMEIDWP